MPRWDMSLCLLLAWILVFLSVIKGIKSSGKVVYFTATFPYVILLILFINGLLQDGYKDGIYYYLKPDLGRLRDATVWRDAAVQIFFSLSASAGGLLAYSSYNRFKTDVVRDTLIVTISNCATSFFAGLVIFSYLGYLAKQLNMEVKDVAASGPGLVFVVYPQAVSLLPAAPFWSIIFFAMLIMLGLDTQFALIETLATSILDQFPQLRKRKIWVHLVTCIVLFALGLTQTTPGGSYLLTIMDDYSGGWNMMIICILECISVAWIYGVRRFCTDIEVMTGPKVAGCIPWRIFRWWWSACWCIFAPILVGFILIFSWVGYKPSTFGSYVMPTWGNALGWLMTAMIQMSIFLPMIFFMLKESGSCFERLKRLIRPTRFWGPALVKHRQLITYVRRFEIDPWNHMDSEYPLEQNLKNNEKVYEYNNTDAENHA